QGIRRPHPPRPPQGHQDRPGPAVRGRRPGSGLEHAQDPRLRRRALGTVLLDAERHRLPRPGVHRSGGPRLRGLAGRPQTGAAPEQEVLGAVHILKKMEPLNIALIGCGTVGSGVAKLLLEHPQRLAARAGRALELRRVVVRDPTKPRPSALAGELLTTDLRSVLTDPSIQVAVELGGGVAWARQ